MKITWFADTTCRIQIAGHILVVDPEGAPIQVDPTELVSGAETIFRPTASELADFDPEIWHRRRRTRIIDTPDDQSLRLYRLGTKGLIADSRDDGMLVIHEAGAQTQLGRWADGATIVLAGAGPSCADQGKALLDVARPRLMALAISDAAIDPAFEALVPHLGDTSLIVLESAMAVEV